MRDIIMDSFKLGLGAIDLTREQAERLVARLDAIYPDEIKDGRRMIEELVEESQKNAERIRTRIEAEVAKAIKEQKLVPEQDLRELALNVKELARRTEKTAAALVKVSAAAGKNVSRRVRERIRATKGAKPATGAKQRTGKRGSRIVMKRAKPRRGW